MIALRQETMLQQWQPAVKWPAARSVFVFAADAHSYFLSHTHTQLDCVEVRQINGTQLIEVHTRLTSNVQYCSNAKSHGRRLTFAIKKNQIGRHVK